MFACSKFTCEPSNYLAYNKPSLRFRRCFIVAVEKFHLRTSSLTSIMFCVEKSTYTRHFVLNGISALDFQRWQWLFTFIFAYEFPSIYFCWRNERHTRGGIKGIGGLFDRLWTVVTRSIMLRRHLKTCFFMTATHLIILINANGYNYWHTWW